ncbi:PIG-L family deacetylase [Paenibacillus melissococcoides]|uniref:PIG-L family deacetylase n=1 Tax=Paenibacillus melissococcoides TaxID=2912268 RepID=A0ABM9G3Q2_9BACL|nr:MULTISPECIES: PIG-L family deacetylase [Paenibacillus]MEB9895655.1 PIG-L family deacetylase [Bacillus cereus]CAH8246281.1 PIG-L family deacetylase [Paenibacillus melissococcoides]CAH8713497.1 PIG-L family deacetylase [Paenibacillus melissococcoides]CAH8714232.1 PIG-L family deacetylase [Paenibacillus melissococcoides]GIO80896.1 putative N-acetyl-alpha-D-glucosaminyl L-malate deacetylase 2 [Paenibacillus dendritiformis]
MKTRWLFVFAHPDDESFAAAGTIARLSSAGHDVILACATSGCKGRSGEFRFASREELARYREQELRNACSILGVAELVLYRYPDGELKSLDLLALAHRIQSTIVERRPEIIITFPPDGVTGHPDHIAISRATETAVERAEAHYPEGRKPLFYYISIPHYYDHCPDSGPPQTCPITARADIRGFRQHKGRALQAYRSQIYSVNRAYPGVMDGDFTVIGDYEYYTLVRANGQLVLPKTAPAALDELPEMELG